MTVGNFKVRAKADPRRAGRTQGGVRHKELAVHHERCNNNCSYDTKMNDSGEDAYETTPSKLVHSLFTVAPRCDEEYSESSRDVDCSLMRASTADSDIFRLTALAPPSGTPWPATDALSTEVQRWFGKLQRVSSTSDFDGCLSPKSALLRDAGDCEAAAWPTAMSSIGSCGRVSSTTLGRRRSSDDDDNRRLIMISPDLSQ